MIRLGFAVRVLGKPNLGLGRGSHLSVGLMRLRDIAGYLARKRIAYYRAPSDLLPEGAEAFAQIAACGPELDLLAAELAQRDCRVSFHLELGAALAAPDPAQTATVLARVEGLAALLARLDAQRRDLASRGVIVAHLGGAQSDAAVAERFVARYAALSAQARAVLALEHDDAGFSLGQLLQIHQRCGVPIVFDALHWALHNPEGLPLDLGLGLALATWPPEVRPEVHLSSPRSEAHLLPARTGQTLRIVPPYPGQHADFVVFADLRRLIAAARGLPAFDLMLEAKAGDLALLRLRDELMRVPAQWARAVA